MLTPGKMLSWTWWVISIFILFSDFFFPSQIYMSLIRGTYKSKVLPPSIPPGKKSLSWTTEQEEEVLKAINIFNCNTPTDVKKCLGWDELETSRLRTKMKSLKNRKEISRYKLMVQNLMVFNFIYFYAQRKHPF